VARLFVAVWPPAAVVQQLRELPRPAHPGTRWTSADQWHVTLRFLGDVDVGAARAALAELHHPSATAVLGPQPRPLGPGVLVLPVAGLDSLAAAVRAATDGLVGAETRPFAGHLTLARARRGACVHVSTWTFVATWPVVDVTLVQSHLDARGARYSDVAAVTLGR
jgi:2'-5' RNA ligase